MPGFAGVDIDKAVSDAGLDGKAPDQVPGGAPAAAPSSGQAPDVSDKGGAPDDLAALMGDDNGAGKAPASQAERDKQAQVIEDFLDLEANKAKKVKIGDQELTLEELQKGYLRQQDYTKKTTEAAKEREYRDNLEADLAKVENDPALLAEFKKLYPKQYHKAAELAARGVTVSQSEKNPQDKGNEGKELPPEIVDRLKKLEESEQSRQREMREREITSYEKEIDATMKELAPKFPLADDDVVITKAQSLLSYMRQKAVERGDDPASVKLTKTHWERCYKMVHEKTAERYKTFQEAQRKKQQDAHEAGKDVAAGGGLPGQAPKSLKLKDVADHMIAAVSQQA